MVHAKSPPEVLDRSVVALTALPAEGQQTYRLIHQGGPFPYEKDGTVFGNRERLLPKQARGHYREYTVKTPGARDRGARRIVCGGEVPKSPEACYYTEDHYASFRMIVQTRN
jgi:ribonuclease T1